MGRYVTYSDRKRYEEILAGKPGYIESIDPKRVGTMNYINLCLKAVSTDGSAIGYVSKEHRTQAVCTAAALSAKSQGISFASIEKYIPEEYQEECKEIYQTSSADKDPSQIEDSVRNKMEGALQDERKHLEAFEKINGHIENISSLKESLDRLYTVMRESRSVQNSYRYKGDEYAEKRRFNRLKEEKLQTLIEELVTEVEAKIKACEKSEKQYFEGSHLCNSTKELDISKEAIINHVGEMKACDSLAMSKGFTEAFNSIKPWIKSSSTYSMEEVANMSYACRDKIDTFYTNSDYIAGVNSEKSPAVSKRFFESRDKIENNVYYSMNDKAKFDSKYASQIDKDLKSQMAEDLKEINEALESTIIEYESKVAIANQYELSDLFVRGWGTEVYFLKQKIVQAKEFGQKENIAQIKADLADALKRFDNRLNRLKEEGVKRKDIAEQEVVAENKQEAVAENKQEVAFENKQDEKSNIAVEETVEKTEQEDLKNKQDAEKTEESIWSKDEQELAEAQSTIEEGAVEQDVQVVDRENNFENILEEENLVENNPVNKDIIEKLNEEDSFENLAENIQETEILKQTTEFEAPEAEPAVLIEEMPEVEQEFAATEPVAEPAVLIEEMPEVEQKTAVTEPVVEQAVLKEEIPAVEQLIAKEEPQPVRKEETLRKKFDINSENDFEELLYYYAQLNKEYYDNAGKKRTPEEINKRRNINAQFKRIMAKKALQQPENENGEQFANTIKNIESGNMFSYGDLKEVAENKDASLMLFNIMASGVYEKDGAKTRLTQKQRIALASTLEIVSGMRLDMNKAKNNDKGTQAEQNLNVGIEME